jgi:hypothetical protein
MSDLQLALLALGGVFIVAVIVYNVWQERRARRKAERAFGEPQGDALFKAPAAPAQRLEPTIGAAKPSSTEVKFSEEPLPRKVAVEELEAPGGPMAEISSRVDTVAVVLADDPVIREQLEPLLDALRSHTTPVHVEGIVDEQWHPVEESPRTSWRELRVGLQLASRSGPVGEEEIDRFNRAIADFAASLGAVSQREAATTAAARARELDRFCADADIEVAVNVVGQFGATFAMPRVKALALENGLSETAAGELISYAGDGSTEFTIRRFEEAGARAPGSAYAGLTFALDVPQCRDPVACFDAMVRVADRFAQQLGGQLVDDKKRPLTDAGLGTIRRTVEAVAGEMDSQGVPAGGALARRLFS